MDGLEPSPFGDSPKRQKSRVDRDVIENDRLPIKQRTTAGTAIADRYTTKAVEKLLGKALLSHDLQVAHLPVNQLNVPQLLARSGSSETSCMMGAFRNPIGISWTLSPLAGALRRQTLLDQRARYQDCLASFPYNLARLENRLVSRLQERLRRRRRRTGSLSLSGQNSGRCVGHMMDHRDDRAIVIEDWPVLRVPIADLPRASFRLDIISLQRHHLPAPFVKDFAKRRGQIGNAVGTRQVRIVREGLEHIQTGKRISRARDAAEICVVAIDNLQIRREQKYGYRAMLE
ncbi:hypothetical protein ACVWY3_007401 [Bradyrhizobium sp. USDA 4486]